MTDLRKPAQISPLLKLVLELGPLAVFFLLYHYGESLLSSPRIFDAMAMLTGAEALASESGPLFLATACFMVVICLSLLVSWVLTRELPKMAVLTALVVAIFGGLTLWLHDDTFIKMKPTIVNGLFALILGIGLLRKRSYLKYLMGESMPLTDRGWHLFTRHWVLFFIAMALINELVWRTQSTDFWVNFKTFASPVLTLGFMASQWPMLQRHLSEGES